MREIIKENIYDFFTCIKISLKAYLVLVVVAILVFLYQGIFGEGFNFIIILETLFTVGMCVSSLGLLLCGGAFIKPHLMEPLNSENQWRIYFYRFGIVKVAISICFLFFVYALSIDYILWFIR
ncbi:hypothetical protein [Clostridium sp.]|uniref:hypothetical protein n=1 Tax=Clostridium sp. TaxID=1506 RepID=UPI0032180918